MKIRFEPVIGVILIVGGAGLWLFARDTEIFWFRGGALGVVLMIVGALDLLNSRRTATRS
ncbi:hypothetical protein G4H71_12965 [Rhodococcus triatomae]|nr:hypothetical protein [Rhodococcus triatomae]QNG20273.1 hypothetical protein G4H72_17415 [Rhodococcus triatomae]QNG23812.1 hypothetical protein G4H71_12965 [Rhodococcus triatomae]